MSLDGSPAAAGERKENPGMMDLKYVATLVKHYLGWDEEDEGQDRGRRAPNRQR